eukprot:GEMP01002011.1.p1 GENE.GEMP01002011.1~~GEMP01002011.1.p1  ORF type:complete len:738 (-),score=110.21 GEMP01002011.1:2766-4979(-)
MSLLCAALFSVFSATGMVQALSADHTGCHGDPSCYCHSNCTTFFCNAMCKSDTTDWASLRSSVITHPPPGGFLNATTLHNLLSRPDDDVKTYDEWLEASGESRRLLKELPESYDFMDEERPDCAVEIRYQKNACNNCYDMAAHYMASLTFCRRLERPFISSAAYLTQCHDGRLTKPCISTSLGLLASLSVLKQRSMVSRDCVPGPARPSYQQPVPPCATTCSGNHAGDPLNPPIPPALISYIVINGGEADMRRALYTQSSISVIMYVDDGPFLDRNGPLDAEPYTCKERGENFPTSSVHAFCIYGWGTTKGGMPYWSFVNSWGTSWGDNGRSRIRRGNDDCYIESAQKAAIIFKDEQKVPNPTTPPSNGTTVALPPPPPPDAPFVPEKPAVEEGSILTLGILAIFVSGVLVLLVCCILVSCYCCRWKKLPKAAPADGSEFAKSRSTTKTQLSSKSQKIPGTRKGRSVDILLKNETTRVRKTRTDEGGQGKPRTRLPPPSGPKYMHASNPQVPPGRDVPQFEKGTLGLDLRRVGGEYGTNDRSPKLGGLGSPRQHDARARDAGRKVRGTVQAGVNDSRQHGSENLRDRTLSPRVGETSPGSSPRNFPDKNLEGESPKAKIGTPDAGGDTPRSSPRNSPDKNRGGERPKTKIDISKAGGDSPRSSPKAKIGLAEAGSHTPLPGGDARVHGVQLQGKGKMEKDVARNPMGRGDSPKGTKGGKKGKGGAAKGRGKNRDLRE